MGLHRRCGEQRPGAEQPAFTLPIGLQKSTWAPDYGDVRYLHVELDSHDVIFAEGTEDEMCIAFFYVTAGP